MLTTLLLAQANSILLTRISKALRIAHENSSKNFRGEGFLATRLGNGAVEMDVADDQWDLYRQCELVRGNEFVKRAFYVFAKAVMFSLFANKFNSTHSHIESAEESS